VYKTTDESFHFHNKKFDEIRCKLDSTENPRSFEKYPTPPYVEMKRFVGSFVNVILTRQTCGQRSSRDAESKRQTIGNYFPSEFAMFSQYQNVEETEI